MSKRKNTKKKVKKILNGIDLKNEKQITSERDNKTQENITNTFNLNENIQSLTSIMFTVIIIVLLIFLVFVIYNNYFKEKDKVTYDVNEVCKDFIDKDYGIKNDTITSFIYNLRGIIYNINNYNNKNIKNENLLEFATYFIWMEEGDYQICDNTLDEFCLTTKKEISLNNLKKKFTRYLNLDNTDIVFKNEFNETDTIRLYQLDNNVILTFSEFEYQTLKHDIVDIDIDEDIVDVTFALSKKLDNSDVYVYSGFKKLRLKYKDKRFIIENIETSLIY